MIPPTWGGEACDACRTSALRGGTEPPLVRLGDAPGPIFLYYCQTCGALWEENLREIHVISKSDARQHFPDLEIPQGPT